jgi:hypothetical protein
LATVEIEIREKPWLLRDANLGSESKYVELRSGVVEVGREGGLIVPFLLLYLGRFEMSSHDVRFKIYDTR